MQKMELKKQLFLFKLYINTNLKNKQDIFLIKDSH